MASKGLERQISCRLFDFRFSSPERYFVRTDDNACVHLCSSIIVDDLLSLQQTVPAPTPVAYFYFSHQDRLAQSPHVVLSCVLRQFLEQLPEIPTAVRSVYKTTHTQGALPHFECERLLVEALRDLTHSYLVLDALDECSDEHRGSLLRTLAQLGQSQGARILITSRPHIK